MTRQDDLMNMARAIAKKATCPKKQVGCVIADYQNNVISYGYNQVPYKMRSCIDKPCSKNLNNCHAVHAEAMALIQCCQINAVHTIYVTLSPCFECAKLICSTACQKVIYLEDYKKSDGIELLRKNNIEVVKYEYN